MVSHAAAVEEPGYEPVAEVRVRGREHHGVFVAQTCRPGRDHLTATGRWRRKGGANYAEESWGPLETFSWPWRELPQVKWTSPEAAE